MNDHVRGSLFDEPAAASSMAMQEGHLDPCAPQVGVWFNIVDDSPMGISGEGDDIVGMTSPDQRNIYSTETTVFGIITAKWRSGSVPGP